MKYEYFQSGYLCTYLILFFSDVWFNEQLVRSILTNMNVSVNKSQR